MKKKLYLRKFVMCICMLLFFSTAEIIKAENNFQNNEKNLEVINEQEETIQFDDENEVEDELDNNDPEAYKWFLKESEPSELSLTQQTYFHNERFSNYYVYDVIDISKHQGDINWTQVRNSGVEYAIIRVGYRGYTNGKLMEDEKFRTNIQNALNAGMKVGVYIFSQAINEAEAVAEAEFVLNRISGYSITLPVVIDFEYASTQNGLGGRLYNANLSKDQTASICNAFCARVAAANYTPMIYANKDMLNNHMNVGSIENSYKIWLANYTTRTDYAGRYDFWQYSSSGQIVGISTAVDCNFWYVQKPQNNQNATVIERLPDGVYSIIPNTNGNTAIDIAGDSSENNANIELGARDGSISQQFMVKYQGDGKYTIQNLKSGKFVEAQGGGTAAGTNVSQYEQNEYDTQKWYIQKTADGQYKIESAWAEGLCLNVPNGNAQSGVNIELYTENGTDAQCFSIVKTGMQLENDTWNYYQNGVLDNSYTGMAYNEYGWWYMTNGVLDWNYTGMVCNEYGWWYMTNGVLDWNYTGMACNEYGWWYMTNGALDWNYTGMAYHNELGWSYVINGVLDSSYTGMAYNEYGWWYMTNGALDWNYTGMTCNEYGWWYMMNGILDWNYTGMAYNEYGWWYMLNGSVAFGYTGLIYDENVGWWYVENGAVNFGYTGVAQNDSGFWYVENGTVRFDYTGEILFNDIVYDVYGGAAFARI